jgi:hypothetical protein
MHKEFEVHMLNEAGKLKAKAIAEAFDTLLTSLENITPMDDSRSLGHREMALVRTKLEEAAFFAKKAMAVQPRNTNPDPKP